MDRRQMILGGAAAMLTPAAAQAAWTCGPYDWRGVQMCEAGLYVGPITAQQRCQNWCWAACIEGIFAMHGRTVPQEEIVDRVYYDRGCRTATGEQIIRAISGTWTDRRTGRRFRARGEAVVDLHRGIWNPNAAATIARELANNNPLINGAVGHATVITAMRYLRDVNGNGLPQSITVRDPWPYRPNKRWLTPQEASGTFFVARVRVS